MKHNWTYKKLGDILSYINDGDWIESKDQAENGIRLIQTGNIGVGEYKDKGDKAKYISEATFLELQCTEIFPGDCLISRLPDPIGRACLLPQFEGRAITAVDCSILRFKDIVLPKYFIFYAMTPAYFGHINKYSTGATRKRISRKNLMSIPIPIPSLSEQQAIVRELDGINHLIDLQEEQLREYDRLAQSLFYTTFGDPATNPKGWEVKKLGEVAKEKLSYGSGASAVMFDGTTRYVRITDIKDNGELNDDIVSPNAIEDKYLLNEGDILFARSGATVGKTYMHKSFNGRCIYAGYLIRLIPNKDIVHPTYLFHLTKTEYYHEFIASGQRTVAQPNINAQQYGNFRFPLPPLALQQSFAAQIEAIEQQKALVRKSLDETRTLLAARMQYYFNS